MEPEQMQETSTQLQGRRGGGRMREHLDRLNKEFAELQLLSGQVNNQPRSRRSSYSASAPASTTSTPQKSKTDLPTVFQGTSTLGPQPSPKLAPVRIPAATRIPSIASRAHAHLHPQQHDATAPARTLILPSVRATHRIPTQPRRHTFTGDSANAMRSKLPNVRRQTYDDSALPAIAPHLTNDTCPLSPQQPLPPPPARTVPMQVVSNPTFDYQGTGNTSRAAAVACLSSGDAGHSLAQDSMDDTSFQTQLPEPAGPHQPTTDQHQQPVERNPHAYSMHGAAYQQNVPPPLHPALQASSMHELAYQQQLRQVLEHESNSIAEHDSDSELYTSSFEHVSAPGRQSPEPSLPTPVASRASSPSAGTHGASEDIGAQREGNNTAVQTPVLLTPRDGHSGKGLASALRHFSPKTIRDRICSPNHDQKSEQVPRSRSQTPVRNSWKRSLVGCLMRNLRDGGGNSDESSSVQDDDHSLVPSVASIGAPATRGAVALGSGDLLAPNTYNAEEYSSDFEQLRNDDTDADMFSTPSRQPTISTSTVFQSATEKTPLGTTPQNTEWTGATAGASVSSHPLVFSPESPHQVPSLVTSLLPPASSNTEQPPSKETVSRPIRRSLTPQLAESGRGMSLTSVPGANNDIMSLRDVADGHPTSSVGAMRYSPHREGMLADDSTESWSGQPGGQDDDDYVSTESSTDGVLSPPLRLRPHSGSRTPSNHSLSTTRSHQSNTQASSATAEPFTGEPSALPKTAVEVDKHTQHHDVVDYPAPRQRPMVTSLPLSLHAYMAADDSDGSVLMSSRPMTAGSCGTDATSSRAHYSPEADTDCITAAAALSHRPVSPRTAATPEQGGAGLREGMTDEQDDYHAPSALARLKARTVSRHLEMLPPALPRMASQIRSPDLPCTSTFQPLSTSSAATTHQPELLSARMQALWVLLQMTGRRQWDAFAAACNTLANVLKGTAIRRRLCRPSLHALRSEITSIHTLLLDMAPSSPADTPLASLCFTTQADEVLARQLCKQRECYVDQLLDKLNAPYLPPEAPRVVRKKHAVVRPKTTPTKLDTPGKPSAGKRSAAGSAVKPSSASSSVLSGPQEPIAFGRLAVESRLPHNKKRLSTGGSMKSGLKRGAVRGSESDEEGGLIKAFVERPSSTKAGGRRRSESSSRCESHGSQQLLHESDGMSGSGAHQILASSHSSLTSTYSSMPSKLQRPRRRDSAVRVPSPETQPATLRHGNKENTQQWLAKFKGPGSAAGNITAPALGSAPSQAAPQETPALAARKMKWPGRRLDWSNVKSKTVCHLEPAYLQPPKPPRRAPSTTAEEPTVHSRTLTTAQSNPTPHRVTTRVGRGQISGPASRTGRLKKNGPQPGMPGATATGSGASKIPRCAPAKRRDSAAGAGPLNDIIGQMGDLLHEVDGLLGPAN